MKFYDLLIFDGKFKEVETLILGQEITLDDLEGEAFELPDRRKERKWNEPQAREGRAPAKCCTRSRMNSVPA